MEAMKLMSKIMLPCKKASELIDKKQIGQLTFKEKIQLKMHVSMCSICAMYEKQSSIIHHLIIKNAQKTKELDLNKVENLKTKIIEKL